MARRERTELSVLGLALVRSEFLGQGFRLRLERLEFRLLLVQLVLQRGLLARLGLLRLE